MGHRRIWADYFDELGIRFAFFSAANAAALQQARRESPAQREEGSSAPHQRSDATAEQQKMNLSTTAEAESSSDSEGPHTPDGHEDNDVPPDSENDSDSDDSKFRYVPTEEDTPDGRDPRTRVLSVLELEGLFISAAPDLSSMRSSVFMSNRYLTATL